MKMKTDGTMKQAQGYATLSEVRAEKAKVSRRLSKGVEKLQSDIVDSFVPDTSFFDSALPYMKYFGYAVTAYKTARMAKNVMSFLHRRKWF